MAVQQTFTRMRSSLFPFNRFYFVHGKRLVSSGIFNAMSEEEATSAKSFNEIPGPRSLPFIGTLYKYLPFGEYSLKRFHESDMRRFERYGPIVREEIFPGIHQVRLFDPEDVATLFRHEGKYPFRLGLDAFKACREARGMPVGIANLQGPEWHRFRSQAQKKMMRRTSATMYIPAQESVAADLVDRIKTLRDDKLEVPNFLYELYKFSTEAIGVVCFDSRLGTLKYDLPPDSVPERFIRAVNSVFAGFHTTTMLWSYYKDRPHSATMRKLASDLDIIWDISEGLIKKTLEKAEKNEELLVSPEDSLLLTLLSKPDLKGSEALSLIVDFFVAGVDTTSHTLAFNLFQLATNPVVQQRLQREIDELVPVGKPVTHEILEEMKYLKAVTKETFRVNATVPAHVRILDKDMVFQGYRVPAGVQLYSGNSVICMRPEYFREPEKFLPERWLEEQRIPFTLLPFGHGPRACLGRRFAEQEIWLGLIKILQQLRVEYHHEPIQPASRLISIPDRPLRFNFIDRN